MSAHTTSALADAAAPAWVSQWRLPIPSRGLAPTSYALYPQPLRLPCCPLRYNSIPLLSEKHPGIVRVSARQPC
jgi:hypothetical protein